VNVSRLRGSIAPIVTPFNNGAVDEATANLVPERVARMYDLWQADDWRGALDLHYELMPLNDVLFVETNPGPLKYAVGALGRITPEIRLPLVLPSEPNRLKIRNVMAASGLVPASVIG
jgi:4-hydroxy-tetrahydrodipicolinate synthase